ncbi:MAG TPA: hypothetical protein VG889_15705 [Rhizomicrobium sp.]|nr:hypothetical protein [Rhizomicrobium sp.]
MLGRLFPKAFDNDYRGHWLGLVLFALAIALRAAQGISTVVATRMVATTADGLSLDGYSPLQEAQVLSLFAVLGLYVVVIPFIGAISLIRYRAMVPFLYLMFLLTQLGVRALHNFHPAFLALDRGGNPSGFYVNLGLLAFTVLGFWLSLMYRPAIRTGER